MECAANENLISFFIYVQDLIGEVLENSFKIHATRKTNIPNSFIKNFKKAIAKSNSIPAASKYDLSAREFATLINLAIGMSNKEITDAMFVPITNVKTHVRNILLKLNAKNRNEAASIARKEGLINNN